MHSEEYTICNRFCLRQHSSATRPNTGLSSEAMMRKELGSHTTSKDKKRRSATSTTLFTKGRSRSLCAQRASGGSEAPQPESGSLPRPRTQPVPMLPARNNVVNRNISLCRPSSILRLYTLAVLMAALMPIVYEMPFINSSGPSFLGTRAYLIRKGGINGNFIRRDNSPTDVCNRWSHQSAVVNGTLYIYGGHSISSSGQDQDTWNNDFVALPLTEGWDISAPKLAGLPQPIGPPAVANGYLWNSYNSLFLYGGEVSDSPEATPDPYSLWEYNIKESSWSKHQNPKTSAGNNSDNGNQPVEQAAEGAGISVPELGKGWYFGGHLDHYTTPGWTKQVSRQYLKSMIEFTFPGYTNNGVKSLSGGKTAGADGIWRNITQGGIQDTATFTNRADGVLVYVPGFGDSGIILSLAGGTNTSFVSLRIISRRDPL